jgi:hypothetical protein
MSMTATVERTARPMDDSVEYDAAIGRLEQRPTEPVGPPILWPRRGATEEPVLAGRARLVSRTATRSVSINGLRCAEVWRASPRSK